MHPRHGPIITPSFGAPTSEQQRQEWIDLEKEGSAQEGFSLGFMGSNLDARRSISARSVSVATMVEVDNHDVDTLEGLDERPVPLDGHNHFNTSK